MPPRVRRFISSERNELVLSMVTAWEITIKANLGKLQLDLPPAAYILRYMGELSLVPLSISFDHIFELSNLPQHHGDPFDRLLIAQAAAHIRAQTPTQAGTGRAE